MIITNEMRAAVIKELLSPGSLEQARKRIEDELVDWRDSGLSILGRNNGLAIKYPDGSPGGIRFGFEDGMRIVLNDRLQALQRITKVVEANSTNEYIQCDKPDLSIYPTLPEPPGDWCGDLPKDTK
jgi:hypothetical protein